MNFKILKQTYKTRRQKNFRNFEILNKAGSTFLDDSNNPHSSSEPCFQQDQPAVFLCVQHHVRNTWQLPRGGFALSFTSPAPSCYVVSWTADAQTLTGSDNAADSLRYISVYEDWQLPAKPQHTARFTHTPNTHARANKLPYGGIIWYTPEHNFHCSSTHISTVPHSDVSPEVVIVLKAVEDRLMKCNTWLTQFN